MSTIFRGWWNNGRCQVTVHGLFSTKNERMGYRATPGQTTGPLAWGVDGPGCRILAYHMLFLSCGQRGLSDEYTTRFASEVLAQLPPDCNFALHADAIRDWLFGAISADLFPTFSINQEKSNGQPVS